MTRALSAFALAWLALATVPSHAEQRIANISQGTNIALALTPDGQSLIVDLLGRLWLLPASGGGARQLTPDDEGARHPRVSPDGRLVVYQRLVDGQWDLWLLELGSGDRRPLTASPRNEREPDFSTDGASVVFASDETGHYCLWSMNVASGVLTQLTEEPGDASFPSMSDRGEIAYIKENGGRSSLRVLLTHGAAAELLSTENELSAPTWRPGGDVLIYNEVSTDPYLGRRSSVLKMLLLSSKPVTKTLTRAEDVFAARVAWTSPGEYFYTSDGQIWRRGIAQVTRQPVHLFAAVTIDSADPEPSIEPLDTPGPHPVAGVTGRSLSEDARTQVFTALGDLWLIEGRGDPRRLTDDEFVDTDASVSAKGDFAVFASDRSGYMDLWRVTLPDGVLSQLTNRPEKAYRPVVSPDGKKVAFLETRGVGDRGVAALRLLDLSGASGARTFEEDLLAPGVPVWDGDELSLRFHATTASAVRDTRLAIDVSTGRKSIAPVFSAERLPRDPDENEGVLPALEWKPAAPDAPYVIQVGRLFDGIRSDYLRHVDVHIEGQRIVAIVGRGMKPLPETVIDARDATVIPGLIDVHAHQSSVMGERLGRAWLAYGVTTVRELTDDLAAAMERAESWASGRRLGPRLIVTPAADGAAVAVPPSPAVPSPIPVRRYSTLRAASSLFGPGRSPAEPSAWFGPDHREAHSPFTPSTSPLNLSYEDVFSVIVQSGTVVTSDLAAGGGSRSTPNPGTALTRHSAFQRLYSAEERALWLDEAAPIPVRALQHNIARLVRAGGQVAAGTEAPVTPYGLGLHMELALLVEAGIPADQVLRIATASNALALGLERQVGTLEEGKLADLVVVNGNPLMNLTEALNVTAVVRGGVWLDQQRLMGGP